MILDKHILLFNKATNANS